MRKHRPSAEEIERLRKEFKAERDELESQVSKLSNELKTLNRFKQEKALIEKENRDLKLAREKDREMYISKLQEKESLALKEKAKLKNEMLEKLNKTRDRLEKMTEDHLEVVSLPAPRITRLYLRFIRFFFISLSCLHTHI